MGDAVEIFVAAFRNRQSESVVREALTEAAPLEAAYIACEMYARLAATEPEHAERLRQHLTGWSGLAKG